MSQTKNPVVPSGPQPLDGQHAANQADFAFHIDSIRFDENYQPGDATRLTTNFANLARGANRRDNLRKALRMIDNRFNALASWDNPQGDRYSVEIEIISAKLQIGGASSADAIPLIEMLNTTIVDRKTSRRIEGVAGNNFSSYIRDYDFSVLLPSHNANGSGFSTPAGFGDLHGNLFKLFVRSSAYKQRFAKAPVICISASSSRTYSRTDNLHPILGWEYVQDQPSATDEYFAKMGLTVRFFMPPDSAAPLAFYFSGDLPTDYTNLELTSVISTMETFQKIYRPEIYNANSSAGACYQPDLKHQDYSLTQIVYDREERSRLGVEQGRFAEEHFISPYKSILEKWSSSSAL
ncbi:DUF1852 domain-containing protein [Aquamicrobium zhengzhouense]|uniref:DUF1852 domain-containing protein n=1 Tax=Aquamicrobium zhengzhouense TaxID=2781738 RepID=A0ABS0SDK1_9HYPH|nr:DUF1852 domain-containing protein [Aquamicrobium zhengzhouense]MBI1621351.1 DUF1852 domain-containing protein [Aquamicrobium zhengzhouense]